MNKRLPKESWKYITGYLGYYEVSDQGRVKSLKRKVDSQHGPNTRTVNERILKQKTTKTGRKSVTLRKWGKDYTIVVHRLVGIAFIPNPDYKPTINHKKGDPADNRAIMLEWATYTENRQHALKMGLASTGYLVKLGSINAKEASKKVIQMANNGIVLARYNSAHHAKSSTGIDQGSISKVCNGKRQKAGGYKWKFA